MPMSAFRSVSVVYGAVVKTTDRNGGTARLEQLHKQRVIAVLVDASRRDHRCASENPTLAECDPVT